MRPLILATALLALLGSSAFAQTTSQGNSQQGNTAGQNEQPGNSQNSSQNAAAIQQIRQDLQKAGFTDIKVVAQSFVVQATSKDGNPVLMTIGPHGMSVFEARSGGSNSGTVGSGAGGSNSTNSEMGTSSTHNQGTRK